MTSKRKKSKYKFPVEDFYKILKQQDNRCFLTGRELLPENTNSEHIVPVRKGGEHEFTNICNVIAPLSKLKRYYTEEEIVNFAADIINWKGKKYGYSSVKKYEKKK
ncbi:HNH endonuclease [Leptospira sarikeiensis]|uniref:HNH endonuclease n=1 Tax=Leptospira sarikeiensis TaxID=2484943 RepID=A0A4R9KD93_9LEPT|nr:HNH endonuclease [Leptospira sarikeiensis]TGL65943.1 HNH endonuclease [Leptospira sarikeiensis]